MEQKKDIWIESVLRSMEGSSKAKPRTHIFDQIEFKIDQGKIQTKKSEISWRKVAAVGAILITANSYFIAQLNSPEHTINKLANSQDDEPQYSLVSNFKLYE